MKYVLSTFAVMILAIFAVVLIGRNSGGEKTAQTGQKKIVVTEFINDESRVELVQFGRVVGQEERRELRITIEEDERIIEVIKGYTGEVERRQTYSNNSKAYDVFMHALDDAGFTRERETTGKENSGLCPLGRRYNYELKKKNETVSKLWNTSCGVTQGSFGGDSVLVRQLFQRQIPDYNTVIRGIVF